MNPPGKDDPSRSRPPPSQPVNSGPSYYSQPPYPPTTSRQLYDPFGGPVLDVGFTPSPYSQVNNRETFRTPALPSQPNISPVYERHEHGSASYARSSQIPWSHRGGSDLNMANEADTSRRSSGELSTNYGYNDPRTSPQLSMNHRPRGNTVGNKVTDEEEIYPSSEEMQSDPEIVDAGSRPEQTLRIRAKTEGGENDAFDAKMDHRKRKRNRTIRSCVPCHNHKRKTGTCVYEIDETRDHQDPDIAEGHRLRRRIAELEQVVREMRQRQPQRASATPLVPEPSVEPPDITSLSQYNKRRVVVDRFARFKIDEAAMAAVASAAEAAGELPDMKPSRRSLSSGESSAKTLNTDSVPEGTKDYGGEPYETYLLPGEEMAHDKIGRKTFLGASAGRSMIRKLRELAANNGSAGSEGEDLLTVPDDAAFTGIFPDLRKTFPFTTIWSHVNFSGEVIGLLPNKEHAELLLASWKEEVCPFFLAWHVPSMESEFRKFFAMSSADKMNVPLCRLSLNLMICSLVSAAYQSLRLCSFLSNPNVYTVQAQIMVNIYLLNSERAADAWSQTGSLVRQCIAMGLHVDPASLDPKIPMRDAEVRRRIWWTVAGLDALLCISFGRPSAINYYKTNLPQDRTDETLSDAPGSAQTYLPPSNVLGNEMTDMTYHAADYQLTIPTYELLDRIFQVDRKYSRSAIYGWFAPGPDNEVHITTDEDTKHTYDDAVRLANDIFAWYSQLPRGIRFEPEEHTAELLLRTRSAYHINQTLALCAKTFMIIMVLHRPYLRADPTAYPQSSEICAKAAHFILKSYTVGSDAKASIFWVWWTMSFRAFHAGAVCAFLTIRSPATKVAQSCLADLRGAISVLKDRITTWNTSHPVQGDLCNGLIRLETLASAATKQKPPTKSAVAPRDPLHLAMTWSPANDSGSADDSVHPSTPLSWVRGFPENSVQSPKQLLSHAQMGDGQELYPMLNPSPFQHPDIVHPGGDGFNGPETLALPQFWASMFGIKIEEDAYPLQWTTAVD